MATATTKRQAPEKVPAARGRIVSATAPKAPAIITKGASASLIKPNTKIVPADLSLMDRMLRAYSGELDAIEKKHRLISTGMSSRERLSTGMLVPDVIMQGGLLPGMYSIAGPEQSAKSTLCMHVFGSALAAGLPIIQYWDAEGSLDSTYTGAILGGIDLVEVFKGSGILPRRARYYPNNVMEEFYNSTAALLRVMPEKVFDEASKTWFYLLPKRDPIAARVMSAGGLKPSREMTTDSHFWCPAERGLIEGVVFMDSYASLIPRATDDADDPKSGMALVAREFSQHLRRVVGRLRNCGLCIFGVNQIRLKPGVMYGSPEYEPGGEALKFYSSVRNQIRARATPDGWERDKETGQGIEDSSTTEGGKDLYAYKHMKNTKNKNGTPFRGGWMRVWTRDSEGQGRGFDPAFDTFEYLRMTGQIVGSKKSFTVKPLAAMGAPQFDFYTFKCLVLAETMRKRDLMKWTMAQLGLPENKVLQVRKACFDQVRSGKAEELMNGGGGDYEQVDEEADDVEEV